MHVIAINCLFSICLPNINHHINVFFYCIVNCVHNINHHVNALHQNQILFETDCLLSFLQSNSYEGVVRKPIPDVPLSEKYCQISKMLQDQRVLMSFKVERLLAIVHSGE